MIPTGCSIQPQLQLDSVQAGRQDAKTPRKKTGQRKRVGRAVRTKTPAVIRLQNLVSFSDKFSLAAHLTASAANDDLQPPNTVALDKSRYEVMVASMSRVAESVRSLVGMGSIPMKARPPDDSFWISRRSSLLVFLFRCKLHGQFRPLTVLL
jgi:hypothetical protein